MVQLPGCGHEVPCLCGGVEAGLSLVCPSGAYRAPDPEVAAGGVPVLHPTVDGLPVERSGGRLHSVLVSAALCTKINR